MAIINVIPVESINSFDHLIFPQQHYNNLNYFRNQVEQFSNTLTDYGRQFIERARDIYISINDSEAIRKAKAVLRYAKGVFNPTHIVPLESLEDLRAAQPIMQRYIMAQPDIRNLYHSQRCDGYSDTYTDMHPGKVGDDHYDYRRVMQDVVQVTDEGWVAKSYVEDLLEGDRELDFDEQINILRTWEIIQMFAEAAKADPTSLFNGEIA